MFPGLVSFCVTEVIHLLMNGSNTHIWKWTDNLKTTELKTVKRNYQISLQKLSTLLLAGQRSTGVPSRKHPSKEERIIQHMEFCSLVFQEAPPTRLPSMALDYYTHSRGEEARLGKVYHHIGESLRTASQQAGFLSHLTLASHSAVILGKTRAASLSCVKILPIAPTLQTPGYTSQDKIWARSV